MTKPANGMVSFLIRDRKSIQNIIIPIFDLNSLHTLKYNYYVRFKEALEIWSDTSKSQVDKIRLINSVEKKKGVRIIESKVSPDWIVGFTEAVGSFYLTEKDKGKRIAHAYGISQKHDKHLLEQIKVFFTIKSKVRYNIKGHWSIEAEDKYSLKRIKKFFFRKLKGRNSLRYRIWSRSFRDKGNYDKLLLAKNQLSKKKIR